MAKGATAVPAQTKGGNKGAKQQEAPPKEKKVRVPFMTALSGKANDLISSGENGASVITYDNVPAAHKLFSRRDHESPDRSDFATEDAYLVWRALELEARAALFMRAAAKMRTNADNFRKFGDPAKLKKVRRFQKPQRRRATK